ncbi:MAG: MFS transporter [Rudaea sp.]|uniref:MFS transporter n=1 Tax=Rudaea sp. TaxID=2136325 RepID=UPI0039E25B9D
MAFASSTTLSRQDLKTLSLAALGGALEFYDFIIFVYLAEQIGALFFPADTAPWLRELQTWGVFAAGYFARPLGGVVMAHFGDRGGRKRMFTLSVFLMAVPTLLIGLLPTYAQIGYLAPLALLVLRIVQGAAVGGEVPGAWTFVAEHVPATRTAFACGTLTSGLTLGILTGSLLAAALNAALTPAQMLDWGWRVPFLLGGLFGFIAVQLRGMLEETPVFEAIRQRRELARELPLKIALRGHGAAVLACIALTWVLTAAVVVTILMTPKLFQKLDGIAPAVAFTADTIATVGLALGNLGFGLAADRFGTTRVSALGCAALIGVVYAFYLGVAAAPQFLYPLSFVAGLSVGVVSVIPTLLVRAFPAPVRFTGVAFSYNLAYALFGGLTPVFIGWALRFDRLAPAHYVAALCLLGIAVVLLTARRPAYAPSSV